MAELKPCPFCGGKFGEIILRTPITGEYRHWDNGCILSFLFIGEEDIEAWNRRTYEQTD